MNYYEHHIGDYLKNTAHLSMLEDAAYRRLLDAYYTREAPLPPAKRDCYKLARAQSKQERDAVDYVLAEYFDLDSDGWHQNRCDLEIAKYQGKQEKARASANARWSKTHSERNANASGNDMRTHSERNANGMHRAPVPSHQSPDTKQILDTSSLTQPEIGGDENTPDSPEGWFVWFNRVHGTQYQATSTHDRRKVMPIFTAWSNAGITPDQVNQAVKRAFSEAKEPIANLVAYVDRVLASQSGGNGNDRKQRQIDEINFLTGRKQDAASGTVIEHGEIVG